MRRRNGASAAGVRAAREAAHRLAALEAAGVRARARVRVWAFGLGLGLG